MLYLPRSLSGLLPGAVLIASALTIAACNKTAEPFVTGGIPVDHRERHPIRLVENEHRVQLLIGSGTGVLTADQRAQVAYMASEWRREGTGHFLLETPKGTPNQRAAAYAAREAQSILRAQGVPQRAIVARSYNTFPDSLGSVRLAYARIEAEAGPCGQWPEDLGAAVFPSLEPMPANIGNRPFYNLGCSTQRNIAAMVSNPEDLVQPRAMTPPYAARRQTVMEKYRKGESPSGDYETENATAGDANQ